MSTCIWLFERDSGGLAGAGNQLEADFNSSMNFYLGANANLGLSSDARQYYAFGQAMHARQFGLEAEADDWWNSDELLMWIYHDHLPVERLPGNNSGAYEHTFGFQGAFYTLTFRYVLGRAVIIAPN